MPSGFAQRELPDQWCSLLVLVWALPSRCLRCRHLENVAEHRPEPHHHDFGVRVPGAFSVQRVPEARICLPSTAERAEYESAPKGNREAVPSSLVAVLDEL